MSFRFHPSNYFDFILPIPPLFLCYKFHCFVLFLIYASINRFDSEKKLVSSVVRFRKHFACVGKDDSPEHIYRLTRHPVECVKTNYSLQPTFIYFSSASAFGHGLLKYFYIVCSGVASQKFRGGGGKAP